MKLKTLPALICLSFSSSVFALGFGEPDTNLSYGTQLDFRIPIYTDAELSDIRATRIPLKECSLFDKEKQFDCESLSEIQYTVTILEQNRQRYLQIRTPKIVNEAFVRIMIRLKDDKQSMVRAFTFLPDMPIPADILPVVQLPPSEPFSVKHEANRQIVSSEELPPAELPPQIKAPVKKRVVAKKAVSKPKKAPRPMLSISSSEDEEWDTPLAHEPMPLPAPVVAPTPASAPVVTAQPVPASDATGEAMMRMTWMFSGLYVFTVILFIGVLMFMQRRSDALMRDLILNFKS